LTALARLEAEVIRRLPASMCRPTDLVRAARQRASHARILFGPTAIHGHTEMAPVWRPLIAALAAETPVQWIAGPRCVPTWVRELGISVIDAPPETPEIFARSGRPHDRPPPAVTAPDGAPELNGKRLPSSRRWLSSVDIGSDGGGALLPLFSDERPGRARVKRVERHRRG
jgi:hypothetical protein